MGDFRAYARGDREPLISMIREFFEHHRSLAGREDPMEAEEAESILQRWLDRSENELLVYIDSAQPVGFVRLRKEAGVCWLEDMAVSSQRRGRGYGRQMMEALGVHLQERGQNSIYAPVMPANIRALEFYVECGFTILNMVELRKDLDGDVSSGHLCRSGGNFRLEWEACPQKTR